MSMAAPAAAGANAHAAAVLVPDVIVVHKVADQRPRHAGIHGGPAGEQAAPAHDGRVHHRAVRGPVMWVCCNNVPSLVNA